MLAHVSFVLSHITRLTDRRTDGRTGSFLVARLHALQRRLSQYIVRLLLLEYWKIHIHNENV